MHIPAIKIQTDVRAQAILLVFIADISTFKVSASSCTCWIYMGSHCGSRRGQEGMCGQAFGDVISGDCDPDIMYRCHRKNEEAVARWGASLCRQGSGGGDDICIQLG
jgi:hypothetical protein